jgi:hypothetical protein
MFISALGNRSEYSLRDAITALKSGWEGRAYRVFVSLPRLRADIESPPTVHSSLG